MRGQGTRGRQGWMRDGLSGSAVRMGGDPVVSKSRSGGGKGAGSDGPSTTDPGLGVGHPGVSVHPPLTTQQELGPSFSL